MDGSPSIDPQALRDVEPEALSQTIRGIEDDALEQQARLARAPLPKERRRRHWPQRDGQIRRNRPPGSLDSARR